MSRQVKNPRLVSSRQVKRVKNSKQRNARTRLRFETLELRQLLSADIDTAGLDLRSSSQPSIAPITWFESIQNAERIPLQSLASVDPSLPEGAVGPLPNATGEWIVQLKKASAETVRQLAAADLLLDDDNNNYSIINGLGSEGLILVRAEGASRVDIEASLTHNTAVDSFHLNQLIEGQATTPNDPEFVAGLMPGLDKIDAKNAWDVTRGSLSTVVGVVDTGIDSTHPDLYLNIWINQGELPAEFLDEVGAKLVDIDGDRLITFYDLNNVTRSATAPFSITVGGFASGPNASFARDLNGNGRIDAQDLLADANWADGIDTDNNGFFDDFFGVNFRAGVGDPFASNNPSDPLGHGTHVAGTIGAIGGNATGVVGVNWQTSLMSLRILDNNNQGDSGAAIRAVNYAREMRERVRINGIGRVTEGANVRVLNNSWGQPGGFESSLETAIADSYEAGILFVAAAGNGNILGNGVDNDRTPFYPASYNVPNVIAISASDSTDRLATFSNFGKTSVDLFAPGVGIRSTLPGGAFGSANGTSMASPHVAGTAALIWASLPEATVDEVKQAILSTVTPIASANNLVSTAGRLNASGAVNANVFAPAARLVARQDVTAAGGTTTEFTVEYSHRSGIDTATIGNDDLLITRQWGRADQLAAVLKPNSIVQTAKTTRATYTVTAPGGTWDALDFGDYVISTVAGKVTTLVGNQLTQTREVGRFNVRINAPSVLYVDSFLDSLENGSLRSAILAANAAAPAARTIILDSGKYTIDIPLVVDPTSTFGTSLVALGVINPGGWSNATTGDFDVQGNVTIVGDTNDDTVIDAQGLDRVFKVHQGASLGLSRLTIQGGVSPETQGGGGILSLGALNLTQVIAKKNIALSPNATNPIFGGAIAAWAGNASLNESWITENQSNFGGGVYLGGTAIGTLQRSTIDTNTGGGLYSTSSADAAVKDSTFSANSGGYGAIANGIQGAYLNANASSDSPALSPDGRFVAFASGASNLVAQDTNGREDIFLFDTTTKITQLISVSDSGLRGNGRSATPTLSADGRFVAFESTSSNLVPGDNNFNLTGGSDVFVYDSVEKKIERVSVSETGEEANRESDQASLSADGRYVAFVSGASNLVPGDNNGQRDIFVHDRVTKKVIRVTVSDTGEEANEFSFNPTISADGRFVSFESDASNLVPGDNNHVFDIFVYDTLTKTIQRVSVNDAGVEGDGFSFYSSLSADGRFVTFDSISSNLVPGDNNGNGDVFVYDRTTTKIQRVSVSDAGVEGNGSSNFSSMSADGRFVTFTSSADNLVPGDDVGANRANDIFVYDRTTMKIQRVSVPDPAIGANDSSSFSSFSGNNRYVVFQSASDGFAAGDTNDTFDIFVYDRTTMKIEPITYRPFRSVIDVSHSTIAFTSDLILDAAVFGDVQVNDSLFVANEVSNDHFFRRTFSRPNLSSTGNIFSSTPQSGLISPLQRSGSLPPVHHLIAGNPAINPALPVGDGTLDQLGQVRVVADVGAVEAIHATVSGKAYVDTDRDGRLDQGEPGIPGVSIIVTVTGGAQSVVTSRNDNPETNSVNESGTLELAGLPVGTYDFAPQPVPGWSLYKSPLDVIRNQSLFGNGNSEEPSLSVNGRFVAFQSDASNLVPGDTNGTDDIFVYDSTTRLIERVNVSDAGVQANNNSKNPSLSADGRYVAFESNASNLVPGDTNGSDIFVYDRTTKKIERVSINDLGVQAEFPSTSPSISADGRYVTFQSASKNLIPGDFAGSDKIFIYDRSTKTIEIGSVSDTGVIVNGVSAFISADGRHVAYGTRVYDRLTKTTESIDINDAGVPADLGNFFDTSPTSLSADGRYAAFVSRATNLVPGDNNDRDDIFVFDRMAKKIERVSINEAREEGNGSSKSPSISADGRFVTFSSLASNLVPGDTSSLDNTRLDVFVFDRTTKMIRRVSVNNAGVEGDFESRSPSISADGRMITFASDASNLVAADNNAKTDIFTLPNPFLEPGATLTLQVGEAITDLNFGLVPDPGTVSGRVFEDNVANGVYDAGEPAVVGALVFLDLDNDRLFDAGETSVITNVDGSYRFLNTDSFLSYSIVVRVPIGFEQIAPDASEQFTWSIFLPAGGIVTERDFAIRRVQSTGQSSASAISGRLFDDRNGNGVFNAGVDVPIVGREVYLDATNFGVRDTNEPRKLTDNDGMYTFTGLSSRNVAVTTTLDETLVHVSPLGSNFALQKYPLFGAVAPFGNPQSIAAGDFNGDGFLDAAVALGEGNQLSIRLNDKAGGFLPTEIDIDLGTGGAGPTSLVIGQFDNDSKLDVALTANFAGNVTVLLNFDPLSKTFTSRSYVKVGNEPLDIAAGQFGGDSKPDLVVVNKADKSVQLLTNNGSGVFTAGAATASGGKNSVSLVVGNFTGDASLDVAVVHASPLTTNTPSGGITVLRGNAAGTLTLDPSYYQVGALPIDSVSADFNGDGRADLAVSNFSSNSISILLGQATGTFKIQTAILGTASGAFDIAVGDVDNDGDVDVIASNLRDRNISIFRNTGLDATSGEVQFEPLENIGLGQFSLAQRMPLVVANFDNDASGPGNTGTVDIVTIPQQTDTLHVLKNKLVNGARRVALTGLNTVSAVDFIIKRASLPPFLTVNTTDDTPDAIPGDGLALDANGKTSLRAALQETQAFVGLDTIRFDIPGNGPHVINLTSPLPTISDPVIIDGTSEPNYVGSPVVELVGTGAGAGANGLTITGGGSSVKGLAINRFAGSGIVLQNGGGNLIEGNFIGTSTSGSVDLGNNTNGIFIVNSASNTIGGTTVAARNVISGNNQHGIHLLGTASSGNLVLGNFIGTSASGTVDVGNSLSGVLVNGGRNNTIGGTSTGARNMISGNNQYGVNLQGATATGNFVQGNYIGTAENGMADLGNTFSGVLVNGARDNTIGGTTTAARNIISGNDQSGVHLSGATTTGNLVQGNYIGTAASGTADLGNKLNGVLVDGAVSNTIGGTTTGARNIISGNDQFGVNLQGGTATANLVQGNYIGTAENGSAALSNTLSGVLISMAHDNTIGGASTAARNVISGNNQYGVYVFGAATSGNFVQGNYIGTDLNGTAAVRNRLSGLLVDAAAYNTIGGTASAAGNVISGNNEYGVYLLGPTATGNVVQGNTIGLAANSSRLGNKLSGILINAAPGNTIGGIVNAARNVISGNNRYGVLIAASTATANLVQGNYIGVAPNGVSDIGNAQSGILISSASGNTIGGTAASAKNVISGNDQSGVYLSGASSTGNLVLGNYIGTDAGGTVDVGNSESGVFISGAKNNTIGGTATGARNVISGNNENGVLIAEVTAIGNVVLGNYIGTTINGTSDLGNTLDGIRVSSVPGNTIGGTTTAARNVVSGNDGNGIQIVGAASTGNLVQGNNIISNSLTGVLVNVASGNTIGGTITAAKNTIASNGRNGIHVLGSSAMGNAILGNSISSNAALGIDLIGNGASANDTGDADVGPNKLQNFPVITSVVLSGANLIITYSVPSVSPNSAFPLRVEFFIADAANQEGATYLGTQSYTATGTNTVTIPKGTAALGTRIVATATDASNNTSEFSTATTVSASLLAAGGPVAADTPATLTREQLQPVVDASIARLAAQGLTVSQVQKLSLVSFVIADLSGATLGSATPNVITLDRTAAGYGWYIDQTPQEDSEFTLGSNLATHDSQLGIDLLTAVTHEFGHVLGLDDHESQTHPTDVMSETLSPGQRRLAFIDAAFEQLENEQLLDAEFE